MVKTRLASPATASPSGPLHRNEYGQAIEVTMSYRILSLDGGGTWALIQIKALIALYDKGPDTRGQDVLNDFDLAAANSGGSIVLGALIENLTLGEILAFFLDEAQRKSVFSKTESLGDRILHDLSGLGPKYSAENKLPALERVLPSRGILPLKTAAAHLLRPRSGEPLVALIVSFDYDRNRATFFRSTKSNNSAWGQSALSEVTLAQAIHASTNAPVNYFDEPAAFPHDNPSRYWDGAITGYNNPILAAVTEAITRNVAPKEIVALSLGTASVALPWPKLGQGSSKFLQPKSDQSFVHDLQKLATSILDDPPNVANFHAHVLTGGQLTPSSNPADSRIIRMSPLISPVPDAAGNWSAPPPMTPDQFGYLAKLDMDAVEQPQVDAIVNYADLWLRDVAPNQPIRMDGDTLTPEVGHAKFSAARNAWSALS
jgi:uncharacterized protein